MKFFLYLGFVTISFAIGECLRCYNCYHGSNLRNDPVINQLINEYRTQAPNERCVINNGEITGPICENSNRCVDMDVDINKEKTAYHFCSYVDKSAIGTIVQTSGDEYMTIAFKICSNNLCNGAASIFTITSLIITLVISLLFA